MKVTAQKMLNKFEKALASSVKGAVNPWMTSPQHLYCNRIWMLMKTQPSQTPSRSRPLIGIIFVLIVVAGIVVILALGLNTLAGFPAQAEALYGPPSPRLSAFQRYKISYQLVIDQELLFSTIDPYGQEILFSISLNESTNSVLNRLEAAQLISDQEAVRNYLIYTGLDTQLQAGDFTLSPAMTSVEIVQVMLDATPRFVTVNILPGWRIEQLAENIPTTGLMITGEEFLRAAYSPPASFILDYDLPGGSSLEGFLLPGSYEVLRDSSSDELFEIVLKQFKEQVTIDIQEGIRRQGLSLYQGVILASIVERENVVPEEMPIIASVFLNRIAINMKLETDPTVQYALGYNSAQGTWWTNPLSLSDLDYDSPYNTYLYNGMPPGPIANPSLTALQAIAFPAETPYYYFRAACDDSGRHNFSQTYEQHLGFACP
jgi:UPF0755 protein